MGTCAIIISIVSKTCNGLSAISYTWFVPQEKQQGHDFIYNLGKKWIRLDFLWVEFLNLAGENRILGS